MKKQVPEKVTTAFNLVGKAAGKITNINSPVEFRENESHFGYGFKGRNQCKVDVFYMEEEDVFIVELDCEKDNWIKTCKKPEEIAKFIRITAF